jgi:magnesium-transporting ATPase (P-type)
MTSMKFLRDTWVTTRQTLKLQARSRFYFLLLLMMVGCGVFASVLLAVEPELEGRMLFSSLSWWLLGVVLVPWTTMYFAVQAIHGDLEDRTVQYIFLRPVSRASLLLGKWLAVSVLCSLAAMLGVLSIHTGVAVHADRWADGVERESMVVFLVGMAAMATVLASVSAFFSASVRWPLVWSTGYVVFVQTLIGMLPAKAGVRGISVADPVRRWLLEGLDADRRLARRLWPSEREWSEGLVGEPLTHLAVILLVALTLSLWVYGRREYDSRPRE